MARPIEVEGLENVQRGLDEMGKKAFRRASADALTDMAKELALDIYKKEVPRTFDGSVSFTERGFRYKRASFKDDPVEAQVFILPQQSKYLKYMIEGGTRRGALELGTTKKGRPIIPTGVSTTLTAAGNLRQGPVRFVAAAGLTRGKVKFIKGKRKALIQNQEGSEFVGEPRGFPRAPFGVWKRLGFRGKDSLQLLAFVSEKARYAGVKFDFFGIAGDSFLETFPDLFDTRIDDELRKLKGWR